MKSCCDREMEAEGVFVFSQIYAAPARCLAFSTGDNREACILFCSDVCY